MSEDAGRSMLKAAVTAYTETGSSWFTDDEFDVLAEEFGYTDTSDIVGDWRVEDHMTPHSPIALTAKALNDWHALIASGKLSDRGTVSTKLDGLSMELQYEGGALRRCLLRGNGISGENVTVNAKYIASVPNQIATTRPTSVWGEVVMSFNNFRTYNAQHAGEGYKTPRNAVSMIRSKTRRVQDLTLLQFVAIDSDLPRETQALRLAELKRLTAKNHPFKRFACVSVVGATWQQVWRMRVDLQRDRGDWAMPMDGLVYVDENLTSCKVKFDPMSAVTEVESVAVQLGRTGVLSFVVRMKPVNLGGVTVRRASGFNAEMLSTVYEGIGPGARVLVSRQGDVIPHVKMVISPSDTPFTPPTQCPVCGSGLEVNGRSLHCGADPLECDGTTAGLVRKYAMSVGIKGLGNAVVSALVSSGAVKSPGDLYGLHPDWLSTLLVSGREFGENRAIRLVNEIQRSGRMTWAQLLGAVGVPGCAGAIMETVAAAFPTPDALLDVTDREIFSLDGIGEERGDAIMSFIETRWGEVIAPLVEVVTLISANGPLKGVTVCVTGATKVPRGKLRSMVLNAGGTFKDSVSRKVNLLVTNDSAATSTKARRARELGIQVVDEAKLLEMMQQDDTTEVDINVDAAF